MIVHSLLFSNVALLGTKPRQLQGCTTGTILFSLEMGFEDSSTSMTFESLPKCI